MQLFKITPLYWKAALSCFLPVISLILVAIALFAGTGARQQQLEEYHVISINISHFGVDVLRRQNPSFITEPRKIRVGLDDIDNAIGIIQGNDDNGNGDNGNGNGNDKFDDLTSSVSDSVGSIPSETVDNLGDDVISPVLEQLDDSVSLPEWYSLHVTNYCQGSYTPNATAFRASYNITNCTAPGPPGSLNLSTILSDHIPFAGSIDFAGLPLSFVQDALDYINGFLLVIFVFYVLSFGFCALSIILAICAPLLDRQSKGAHNKIAWAQLSIACLACLWLTVASVSTTLVATKGAAGINDAGREFGVSAYGGTKLISISWAAFAVIYYVFSPYSQLQDK
ncbi:actin cortical patch SUR7/pH-response regulator pali [Xylaria arbuscula]|nr:actin cortical patch SUR7/pH-response regulator pali [Xylaria arbuscula]